MVAIPQVNVDDMELGFGKYKGYTPSDLLDIDPSYIVWMYENVQPIRCSRELYMDACSEVEDQQSEYHCHSKYYDMDESPWGEIDWNDNWRG